MLIIIFLKLRGKSKSHKIIYRNNYLTLINIFTINNSNNNLPLIKLFTVNNNFYSSKKCLLLIKLFTVNNSCLPLMKIFTFTKTICWSTPGILPLVIVPTLQAGSVLRPWAISPYADRKQTKQNNNKKRTTIIALISNKYWRSNFKC